MFTLDLYYLGLIFGNFSINFQITDTFILFFWYMVLWHMYLSFTPCFLREMVIFLVLHIVKVFNERIDLPH